MGEKIELNNVLVQKIDGLEFLVADANASLDEIEQHSALPVLVKDSLKNGTNWHHRNEYTVEKSLLSPSLAQQWVAALLALGATLEFEDGAKAGVVDLLARRGIRGKIKSLWIPLDDKLIGGESHVSMTPGDVPIVSATVGLVLNGDQITTLRVALAGSYKESVRLSSATDGFIGKKLNEDLLQEIAASVEADATPKADYRGSEEYRKKMTGVLTRRALETCWKGALK